MLGEFVAKLKTDFPDIAFKSGDTFKWVSSERTVIYGDEENGHFALLHELGHALLGHDNFRSDLELIGKELDAWTWAQEAAANYDLKIDQDYIEECMETYRNWLHQRSTCPKCEHSVLQGQNFKYKCQNCFHEWLVSNDQYCSV